MAELFRFACTGYPRTLSFSPDGNTLCSWHDEYPGGKAVLWDVAERMELATLTHPNGLKAARVSPDGKVVYGITGQGQYELVAWDAATEQPLAGEGGRLGTDTFRLAVSPDGATLATLGSGQKPRLWDAATRQPKAELDGFSAYNPCDLAFTPDGKYLVALGPNAELTAWLVARGKAKALPPLPTGIQATGLVISPDGTTIAIADERMLDNPCVLLVDLGSGTPRTGFTPAKLGGRADHVAFSADGKAIAVGTPEGIFFLDAATGGQLGKLDVPELASIAYSPDGKYFLAGTARDIRVFPAAG